jgi:hypothetical protein
LPASWKCLLGFPWIQSVTRDASGKIIDCYRAWLRTDQLRLAVETDNWAKLSGQELDYSLSH